MSQGAAAMVGTLHQRVCECMTMSAWAHRLLFLLTEKLSRKPLMVHFD